MIANSVLRLFLMLSIIIIVAGILLIIFMQFDRGYVFTGNEQDYRTQQGNLIDHVYQTQVKPDAPADTPPVMKLNKATVVIQSEANAGKPAHDATTQPVIPQSPVATAGPQPPGRPSPPTSNTPWQQPAPPVDDYYTQLLRNNPWSPHYKPGY